MEKELSDLLNKCRDSLIDASQNPDHNWKLFTMASITKNNLPNCRYVVLRDTCFDGKAELTFFTDQRSQKVDELIEFPHASLCFFDRSAGLQLTINCNVSLHNDDDVSQYFWEKTSRRSLQCYYMREKPGEALTAPFMLNTKELTEEQAYSYFTVVKCSMKSWDILQLNSEGNQRAFCDFSESGEIENSRWAAP